jgi:Carboxypeptidase regulatory-like domain
MKPIITTLSLLLLLGAFPHFSTRADICVADTLKVSHVSGRVVSLWRGGEEPIARAVVELRTFFDDEWHTKFKVGTDEKGTFQIKDVPSGKYEILVTSEHFHGFGTRVKLKASKANSKKEIVVTLGLGLHDCGSARIQRLSGK